MGSDSAGHPDGVFSVFLGHYANLPNEGVPYPLITFTALVPWTLFESGVTASSSCLGQQRQPRSKVYFPRLLIPIGAVLGCLVDFAIAFVIVIGMLSFYGVSPNLGVVLLPAFTVLAVVTALGLGTLLAALNVRYRDFQYAAPFLIQVLMFATPVLYVTKLFPPSHPVHRRAQSDDHRRRPDSAGP